MPKFNVTFVARNRDAEEFMGDIRRTYEIEASDKWDAQAVALGRLGRTLRRPNLGFYPDGGLGPGYGALVTGNRSPKEGGAMNVRGLIRIDVEQPVAVDTGASARSLAEKLNAMIDEYGSLPEGENARRVAFDLDIEIDDEATDRALDRYPDSDPVVTSEGVLVRYDYNDGRYILEAE